MKIAVVCNEGNANDVMSRTKMLGIGRTEDELRKNIEFKEMDLSDYCTTVVEQIANGYDLVICVNSLKKLFDNKFNVVRFGDIHVTFIVAKKVEDSNIKEMNLQDCHDSVMNTLHLS